MQQEEIKKIAKEYALKHSSAYVTASLIESIINGFTEQLSKDYCIVPKESVAEWVNDIESFMPDKRSVTMLKIGAKSLFGKSLFEE